VIIRAVTSNKLASRAKRRSRAGIVEIIRGPGTGALVVTNRRVSLSALERLGIRNPVLLDEDEADYQFSMMSLKSGKSIPLSKVLRRYGRR
jgi:hypothetical protein